MYFNEYKYFYLKGMAAYWLGALNSAPKVLGSNPTIGKKFRLEKANFK